MNVVKNFSSYAQDGTFCLQPGCPVKTVGRAQTILIAYAVSAVVLVSPILNALTAKIPNVAPINTGGVSITAVLLFASWVISAYLTSRDRHTHVLSLIISSAGMPGIIFAIINAVAVHGQ